MVTRVAAAKRRAPAKRPVSKAGSGATPAGPPPWVGEWPRLVGEQRPKFEHSQPGDETDSVRAAKFTSRVTGSRCLPWQWETTRKMLRRREDGLWTHRDVCLVCTRQQGKTWIMVARILFGLFYLGETIVYSAQRGQTADAVFVRIVAIIKSRPSLFKRVVSITGGKQGRGDIVVTARNGKQAHLRCGVRSTDLGRGLDLIDLVVFDEAYNLTEAEVSSLLGAQVASPNAQTVYTSTAPVASIHVFCDIFTGVRERGRLAGGDDEPDLLFEEFAAPDPPGDEHERAERRTDRSWWRLASPSYGVISKERDIESFRKTLCINVSGTALWEADYLGWGEWPSMAGQREPTIPLDEVWRPLADVQAVIVGQKVVAVSRSQDRARWAFAVGCRTSTGRVQVEIGRYDRMDIGQASAYLVMLVDRWDPAAVVIEGHDPATPLAAAMRKLGVDVHLMTAGQFAMATAGFVDSAFSGDVSHTDQPILRDTLQEAVMRALPRGDQVWDAREGSIAPLIAATGAHWAVLEFAEEDGPTAAPVGAAENLVATSSDFDALSAAF